jgi:hypothetical protein
MLLAGPHAVAAQEAAGFDGYIQSGTCDAPTDDLRVDLESEDDDHDLEPYLGKFDGSDGTATLAYYGAPLAPGFGYATIFTDEVFSLVISDTETGDPVACGDILEPDDENFAEVGLALVRLAPVGGSGVEGFAVIERTATQRELDEISTQVRILLSTDVEVAAPDGTPEATPVT